MIFNLPHFMEIFCLMRGTLKYWAKYSLNEG